ncbi:unnamed protein product [Rotaria sp. Silwood1]|nr:unnamed protein product [Rotaria sp. Silwood1]CAF1570421.1 unnamed protein product [Rotaria sp. Silwood1]CAF3653552.1 unnamed protein product [Rotaria sp. Silwood1]CAF3673869.1 unnamed protein product [Rotaria sp. Silwood1]CAF5057290.1 unnamed protein product [Rotaria sp. Silwood1]
MKEPVNFYSVSDDQPIHFRICLLIEMSTYDKSLKMQIPISDRNATIGHLLRSSEMKHYSYKYLASNQTQQVISENQKLLDLNETKFILVTEDETCFVSIETLNKSLSTQVVTINMVDQHFTIYATLAAVYKQNNIDQEQQNLLYSNDFVPSIKTQLKSFRGNSPVRFTLIKDNLPIIVRVSIILNDEECSTEFHCGSEIKIERLCQIACQLLNVKNEFYQLMIDDSRLDDNEMLLNGIISDLNDIQLHLICTAAMESFIKYEDQTIILPCNKETLISTIYDEACAKFCITKEDTQIYELYALDVDQTQVELDMTIDQISSLFSEKLITLPFLIKKKKIMKKQSK